MLSAIILKNKNTYSWTPLQQPHWGQKKVAVEECRDCLPKQNNGHYRVMSKVVSAGYSAWHFFTDGVFKIKYPGLAAYFDTSAV